MFVSRTDQDQTATRPARKGLLSRRGPLRRFIRGIILICVILFGIFLGGFLWFADSVASMRPPEGTKGDAIIVLTGGYQRIEQAVGLLRDGVGKRLLISGVNPATTRTQIRKMTQGSSDMFSCCVDMGYKAMDTIGNANEAASWIRDHNYSSIVVVTNNYHMHRSLHELRSASPQTRFIAYPVISADLARTNWFVEPDVVRTMLYEYLKFVAAAGRDLTGFGKGDGLRKAAADHSMPKVATASP
ncbi:MULTISPECIES: YdcF family protein [Agrobacterium]|uniref:YdcF family protein n=1 Tax=Agrobacterium burrii TaxID=2815339 RepID=A0ABS3EDU8_9HYPH|nr:MULTISPECIES: YdcF family protein [Agrobacterium]MBO0130141.1 YdcF family protein [Agrobacterium burrii]MQB10181.1 YdcF family protein [Agrobacterium sp. ICMP 6402]